MKKLTYDDLRREFTIKRKYENVIRTTIRTDIHSNNEVVSRKIVRRTKSITFTCKSCKSKFTDKISALAHISPGGHCPGYFYTLFITFNRDCHLRPTSDNCKQNSICISKHRRDKCIYGESYWHGSLDTNLAIQEFTNKRLMLTVCFYTLQEAKRNVKKYINVIKKHIKEQLHQMCSNLSATMEELDSMKTQDISYE